MQGIFSLSLKYKCIKYTFFLGQSLGFKFSKYIINSLIHINICIHIHISTGFYDTFPGDIIGAQWRDTICLDSFPYSLMIVIIMMMLTDVIIIMMMLTVDNDNHDDAH